MAYQQSQRPNYQGSRSQQQQQPYAQDSRGWQQPQQNSSYNQGGDGYNNGGYQEGDYGAYENYDNTQHENSQGGYGGYQQDYGQQQYYDDQSQDTRQWQNNGYDQGYGGRPPPQPAKQERTRAPSRQHQMQQDARAESRAESRGSNRSRNGGRILQAEPTSPVTTAWDNPFPVFPAKKKGKDEEALTQGMGDIDLHDKQQSRPGTSQDTRSDPRQEARRGPAPSDQGRSESRQDGSRRQYGQTRSEPHQEPSRVPPVQEHPPRSQSRQDARRPPPQAQYDQQKQQPYGQSPNTSSGWQDPKTGPPAQDSFTPQPLTRQQTWQEPGTVSGHYGPDPNNYPQRPNTAGANTRPPPDTGARSFSKQQRMPPPMNEPPRQRNPPPPQRSYTNVADQYYPQGEQVPPTPDVPSFNAQPPGHRRGASIDDHISTGNQRPQPAPVQQAPKDFAGQAHKSRSQPDLRGQAQAQGQGPASNFLGGFSFETGQNAPQVPPMPSNYGQPPKQRNMERMQPNGPPRSFSDEGYQVPPRNGSFGNPEERSPGPGPGPRNGGPPDWQTSQAYSQQRRPGPGPAPGPGSGNQGYNDGSQRGPPPNFSRPPTAGSGRPSRSPPDSRNGGTPTSLNNPDALPAHPPPHRQGSHPTPVRAGLMRPSGPNQAPGPAPVRQYTNDIAPMQQNAPPENVVPPKKEKRKSDPITHAELARLQEIVKAKPNDAKTQLILAKKWVEAANVLAGEGGRADAKTKNRNREKYIFDAHKLVKKLVNQGNPDAMFYLADCHGQGLLGLVPDPKEAFSLYVSAAKLNHPPSCYRVAVCCEMGLEEGGGTRRDPLKAIQWYKRAATLKDTAAMYKMGMIMLKGLLGQTKNPRDAIVWLKRAADRADDENPHALHELGLLYESASPNDSIVRDENYSRQLFIQAADLGYKFSQYRLGQAYEYGHLGCPIDPRESIQWYSKGAGQEEHQSELSLSGWYLTGAEGILQQSDTEAYLWARKAATSGLPKAEYAMGYFTEVGIGAPANLDDAKRWYWRAASQNYPKARERLEDLKKGGQKMTKKRVSRSAVNRQSEGECTVM